MVAISPMISQYVRAGFISDYRAFSFFKTLSSSGHIAE